MYMYIPRTQMTLVLNGKGLVLGGWPSKIGVIGVLGIYIYIIYIYIFFFFVCLFLWLVYTYSWFTICPLNLSFCSFPEVETHGPFVAGGVDSEVSLTTHYCQLTWGILRFCWGAFRQLKFQTLCSSDKCTVPLLLFTMHEVSQNEIN